MLINMFVWPMTSKYVLLIEIVYVDEQGLRCEGICNIQVLCLYFLRWATLWHFGAIVKLDFGLLLSELWNIPNAQNTLIIHKRDHVVKVMQISAKNLNCN